MNIALEKTEEYVNGRLRRSYGDAFVRGNNGKVHRLYHVNSIQAANKNTSHVYLVRFLRIPCTNFPNIRLCRTT